MNDWASAPERWCTRICGQLLVSATQGENVVVVRTVAGGAPMLAAAIDAAALDSVLGTVAGNDTVLLVARTADEAARLTQSLLDKASGRGGAAVDREPDPVVRPVEATVTSTDTWPGLASPGRTRV